MENQADTVTIAIDGRVYRNLKNWTDWAMTTPEALAHRLLCEWLATQETKLHDEEGAQEWRDYGNDLEARLAGSATGHGSAQ